MNSELKKPELGVFKVTRNCCAIGNCNICNPLYMQRIGPKRVEVGRNYTEAYATQMAASLEPVLLAIPERMTLEDLKAAYDAAYAAGTDPDLTYHLGVAVFKEFIDINPEGKVRAPGRLQRFLRLKPRKETPRPTTNS